VASTHAEAPCQPSNGASTTVCQAAEKLMESICIVWRARSSSLWLPHTRGRLVRPCNGALTPRCGSRQKQVLSWHDRCLYLDDAFMTGACLVDRSAQLHDGALTGLRPDVFAPTEPCAERSCATAFACSLHACPTPSRVVQAQDETGCDPTFDEHSPKKPAVSAQVRLAMPKSA